MVIGVCRIVLAIPGNDSLKGKRKVVRSVIDRLRSRFNVAVAEVEDMDNWRRAVVGLAVVSNDTSHVHAMLDNIRSFVAEARGAVLLDHGVELVHVGELRPAGGPGGLQQ